MTTKQQLRTIAKQNRDKVSDPKAAQKLCDNFLTHAKLLTGEVVASYHPINSEIDTKILNQTLVEKNFHVCLPTIKDNHMGFKEWATNTKMQQNKFGILEPTHTKLLTPQIIIIPLLAFDKNKHRLGYGGGFYDRYLVHSSAKKIGVAYSGQEIPHIPHEEHDIRLDLIITEDKVIK